MDEIPGAQPEPPLAGAGVSIKFTRGQKRKEQGTGTREALLDSAEKIMLEQGYAAVSSRRLAAGIGADGALVYYYFHTMDDLFIGLFHRVADRNLERQKAALASRQPLWGLWHSIYQDADTALFTEFSAAANHRPSVRAEIAAYSKRIRKIQTEAIRQAFDQHGIRHEDWPPESISILLAALSRFIVAEETSGVHDGHRQAIELVERHIRSIEGDYRQEPRGVPG